MNSYRYEDITVGMSAQFEVDITEDMQRKFTDVSGDTNPMHVDVEFARRGGYKDRLVTECWLQLTTHNWSECICQVSTVCLEK